MAKSEPKLPQLIFVAHPHYNDEDLSASEIEADLIDSCQDDPGDVVVVLGR